MNQDEYDDVTTLLADKALNIEETKRPGYTTNTMDVLSNFKRVADQIGTIPEKVLMVYMLKHLDSIRTVLNDIESGKENVDPEGWEGRLCDIYNYVRLLFALMWERDNAGGPAPSNGGMKHE